MNSTILNRDFQHPADGWYQIEPKGNHPNGRFGVVQVIDDEAAVAIVNRFNADADKPGFAGMLVDHEHFKHDAEKETRAYGWLMKLQNRADGIYGQVRWSGTGKAAVDGGDYRFFSTEYDPADLRVLNSGAPKRVRPLRLDGLTLTNDPNNKGGKPITNRGEQFRHGMTPPADNNKRKPMKTVATKLGLSAEASEETILAEITKVMNHATDAEGKVTPLTNRVIELETANATLLAEQIDADFATAGIKDEKIINRHRLLLADAKHFKNRQERLDFIKDLGKPETAQANPQKKLFNRDTTQPGAKAGQETNGLPDAAAATKIMNRASALRKEMPNLSLATSVRMAQQEEEATN